MKQVKKADLVDGESYLVFMGTDYSHSGYDIATFDTGVLISDANGVDIGYGTPIYKLPKN